MSSIVRDLRSIWNQWDDATQTDGTGANNTRDTTPSDPDPIEGTACVGMPTAAETRVNYVDATAADLSNTLVYGWTIVSPPLATSVATDPGIGIMMGDGTNTAGFGVGGADKAGFRHDANRPDWNAFVLDTTLAELDATYSTYADAEIGNNTIPTFTTISRVGYAITRLAAVKGGVNNTFMDIIRYGTEGIQIVGDSATATSRFIDVATEDRSGDDGKAYASVREIGQNSFSIMAKITLGDSAGGTLPIDFQSLNETVLWEARDFAAVGDSSTDGGTVTEPRLGIIGKGAPGSITNSFTAGNRVGEGLGDNGSSFIVPSGVEVLFDFTDSNWDTVGIYGSTFRNAYQIKLTEDLDDSAAASETFQSSFIGCGSIFVGGTEFRNNTITNSSASGLDAAVHLKRTTGFVSDLTFASSGTGHAISIDSATANQSFTFSNFEYTGYAATSGNTGNEVLINNSGQPISITVTGGDTPTVDSDGVRPRTEVIAAVTVTLGGGLLGNSEVKVLENPSPYTSSVASPVNVDAIETVNAVTGTDITYDSSGGEVITISSTTTDFTTLSLTGGDEIRVTNRADDLVIYDIFEVVGTPTTNQINVVDKPNSQIQQPELGFAPTGEEVTVEQIGASFSFSATSGQALDILVFRVGSEPVYILDFPASTTTIPVTQSDDRNYENP